MSEPLNIISLGAGVQSTTMALMAAHGLITPMPDAAIFADTGDEKRRTYAHLDRLEKILPYPLIRVRRSEMSLSESTIAHYAGTGGFDQTPPFFFPGGMLAKHCSKEWKTRVVGRKVREMIGLVPGQRGPKGVAVYMWIGISRDEAQRMKPNEAPWIENIWPLIDKNMRRGDCEKWLARNGHEIPVRSACVFCPYASDAEREDMKNHSQVDDDWERATHFDFAIRPGGNGTYGPLYVSNQLKPLSNIEFGMQGSLFGNECEGMCGV